MLVWVGVLLAQAAAWSGGSATRPPECVETRGRASNVWERAKSPARRRYCDLLASAASKLAGTAAMAEAALDAAREADGVLPGHGAPLALKGRAFAALGNPAEALAALRGASALDPGVLEDTPTLLVWARVLALTGRFDEARDAYRSLLPRVSVLSSSERAGATLEAGLVAMSAGPAGLDEAIAALREAARDAEDDGGPVAVLGLSLALDRRGDTAEARALVFDRGPRDPRAALSTPRARELLAVAPGELPALIATALDVTDAPGALAARRQYVAESAAGPWRSQTLARISASSQSSSPRSPGEPARR